MGNEDNHSLVVRPTVTTTSSRLQWFLHCMEVLLVVTRGPFTKPVIEQAKWNPNRRRKETATGQRQQWATTT